MDSIFFTSAVFIHAATVQAEATRIQRITEHHVSPKGTGPRIQIFERSQFPSRKAAVHRHEYTRCRSRSPQTQLKLNNHRVCDCAAVFIFTFSLNTLSVFYGDEEVTVEWRGRLLSSRIGLLACDRLHARER